MYRVIVQNMLIVQNMFVVHCALKNKGLLLHLITGLTGFQAL